MTKHLKPLKYCLETGQALGFCQKGTRISALNLQTLRMFVFTSSTRKIDAVYSFKSIFRGHLFALTSNRSCRDGPVVLKHGVLLVSEQVKAMCSCCRALMGIPRFQSRSQAGQQRLPTFDEERSSRRIYFYAQKRAFGCELP